MHVITAISVPGHIGIHLIQPDSQTQTQQITKLGLAVWLNFGLTIAPSVD